MVGELMWSIFLRLALSIYNLFYNFWLCWVSVAMRGLFVVVASGLICNPQAQMPWYGESSWTRDCTCVPSIGR